MFSTKSPCLEEGEMLSGLRQLATKSEVKIAISNAIVVILLVAFSEQCNKGMPLYFGASRECERQGGFVQRTAGEG